MYPSWYMFYHYQFDHTQIHIHCNHLNNWLLVAFQLYWIYPPMMPLIVLRNRSKNILGLVDLQLWLYFLDFNPIWYKIDFPQVKVYLVYKILYPYRYLYVVSLIFICHPIFEFKKIINNNQEIIAVVILLDSSNIYYLSFRFLHNIARQLSVQLWFSFNSLNDS